MTPLIKLGDTWVNPAHVVSLDYGHSIEDGLRTVDTTLTIVRMSTNKYVVVKEPQDTVAELIARHIERHVEWCAEQPYT